MSTRVYMQGLSLIVLILAKIIEVVKRWVTVDVWVRDSTKERVILRMILFICSGFLTPILFSAGTLLTSGSEITATLS